MRGEGNPSSAEKEKGVAVTINNQQQRSIEADSVVSNYTRFIVIHSAKRRNYLTTEPYAQ